MARTIQGCFLIFLCLCAACSSKTASESQPSQASSNLSWEELAANGDWQAAWSAVQPTLTDQALDAETLQMLSRVAYEVGEKNRAGDFMLLACEKDSWSNEERVQFAIKLLAATGRAFDVVDLLTQTVTQHPDRSSERRVLFDFLIGMERRQAAMPHALELLQRRDINFELLHSLIPFGRRNIDPKMFEQLARLHPTDPRPLIGKARTLIESGKADEGQAILTEILQAYPDDALASIMQAKQWMANNEPHLAARWMSNSPPSCRSHSEFWELAGSYAERKGHHSLATACFARAAQIDPQMPEVWLSLLRTAEVAGRKAHWSADDVAAIQSRVSNLTRLRELRSEAIQSQNRSAPTLAKIAQTLQRLGRFWEAEAWAALAIAGQGSHSPADEDARLELSTIRDGVLGKMHRNMPLQVQDGFVEFDFLSRETASPQTIDQSLTEYLSKQTDIGRPVLTDAIEPSDAIELRSAGRFGFRNEAKQRNLSFFGRTADRLDQPGISLHKTLGCSVGAIDYDLDSWPDLYLTDAGGTPPARDSRPNRLFRNHDGKFNDVSEWAGVEDLGFSQGQAVGDVNEDGFPDLLVFNYGPNTLYLNNGDGTFSDRSDLLPKIDQEAWSATGVIADLNRDGISDIVIVNYCDGLDPVKTKCSRDNLVPPHRSCSPIHFAAAEDWFLKASPEGTFEEVTQQWNAIPQSAGRGLGVIAGSLLSPEQTSVYVANDMSANHLWSPQPTTPFQLTESAVFRGVAFDRQSQAQGSMGIAFADLNHDRRPDLYVTNFSDEYNTLYSQVTEGVWNDVTSQSGLAVATYPMVGFGVAAIDADRDGTLELAVANGHVDFVPSSTVKDNYFQPFQMFGKTSPGTYAPLLLDPQDTYFHTLHCGRGLAVVDANGDDMDDLVVTHQTEPVALLINTSDRGSNWVAFRLVGTVSARDAIGAVLTLESEGRAWTAQRFAGGSYFGCSAPVLRFGLGDHAGPLTLTIQWPDGTRQEMEAIACNAEYLIVQGASDLWKN